MNKKNLDIVYGIVVLFILGIVIYFSLRNDMGEILRLIKNLSLPFLLISILLFIIYRIIVGLSIYFLVDNSKENISLLKSIQLSFIVVLFNGITPFASGGQPMSIYYLHKERISIPKATNIILQNIIMYQTSLILVGVTTILYNHFYPIFPYNSLMRRLVVLGFLINFGIWLVTFLLAFGKKSITMLLDKIVIFLNKIKLIKDLDKYLKKIEDLSDKFYGSAKNLLNSRGLLFKEICINVIGLLCLYSIPYFLARGFNIENLNLWYIIVSTSYVMIMGSFVPTPGGTGGIEYGFMYFFGYLIKGSVLSALMLVWRFITYYGGMLIGSICLLSYRKKSKI